MNLSIFYVYRSVNQKVSGSNAEIFVAEGFEPSKHLVTHQGPPIAYLVSGSSRTVKKPKLCSDELGDDPGREREREMDVQGVCVGRGGVYRSILYSHVGLVVCEPSSSDTVPCSAQSSTVDQCV